MNLIIIYFALKYKGYFHDIYNALKNKEYVPIEEIEKIRDDFESNKIKAITIIDEEYPEELKLINNPPFVLFYEGNKELLKNKKMILTGDFNNNQIKSFVNNSINELTKNHTIVSNYSKGLEEEIVKYTFNKNKNVILISPNGLKTPFFANDQFQINKNSLIISEYPEGVNLNKRRLVERNRITIGLSKALIIASSYKESRILSLVSYALEQGKDIYCYPGLQDEEDGNNLLIRDGAIMITSIKDTTL